MVDDGLSKEPLQNVDLALHKLHIYENVNVFHRTLADIISLFNLFYL